MATGILRIRDQNGVFQDAGYAGVSGGQLTAEAARAAAAEAALTAGKVSKGDLVVNVKDYASIQAALDAAPQVTTRLSTTNGTTTLPVKRVVEVPAGYYEITAGLTLPQGVSLTLSPNAYIKATATMTAMLSSGTSTLLQDQEVTGGIWDCNALAESAISLPYFAHLSLRDMYVYNSANHAVVLGDPSSTNPSYEAIIHNLRIWRAKSLAVPTGSYGLWLRSTDNMVEQVIIVGADTSVRVDGGNSQMVNCHGWGYTGKTPSTVFDDNASGTIWMACYADTPSTYGFRLRSSGARLYTCTAFNSSAAGSDGVAIGIQIDGTSPSIFIEGFRCFGGDATHRFANDILGDTSGAVVLGTQSNNTVTTLTPNIISQVPNKVGLALRNGTGNGDLLQGLFSNNSVAWRFLGTGVLQFLTGGVAGPGRTVTAATTIVNTDGSIVFNSSSAISQSLPAATAVTAFKPFELTNIGTGVVTLPDTISGTASRTLAQWASITVKSTGSIWILQA